MIHIHIVLEQNHIHKLSVKGHAQFFAIEEITSIQKIFRRNTTKKLPQTGSIPCAAVSILCKSFIDSVVLYAVQKKVDKSALLQIVSLEEGNLEAALTQPDSPPHHIHRYAVEQLLIIGFQAVAKEYRNDIQLKIENK